MPRQPRPWFRRQTGWWMVQIDGKQVKLAQGKRNKALAQEEFHGLMLLRADAPECPDVQVASICEAFLDWSHRRQAHHTYRGYLFYVQSFCEKWGQVMVREVRPYHVTRWLDGNDWNDTTRYNAIRSVFRVFNWAAEEGLISANPLKGMKRPRPKSRQRYLTEDEYSALIKGSKGVFRTLLFAFRQTGGRPSELCELTWDQVHPECWILEEHKTADKVDKPRVIYLVPAMVRLMRFLRRWSRSKYVFVNSRGRKWTVNAIHHRLVRLRRKLGLADDITAYTFRHSFGTHAVLNGVDLATLAELMGHVDTTMVSNVYVHLAGQTDHLKNAAQKAVTKPSPNGRRRGA